MAKHRTPLLLLVTCCACISSSGQNRYQLSQGERQQILDGQFKVISTTDAIPSKVKQGFSDITRQQSFAMANPNQKYQVGDVVLDRNLAHRRLIFAGASDDRCFIHYERGGRGVGYYVVVFKVNSGGNAHFVWGGAGGSRAKNLEQLRKMVATGQFSDAETY
jgi:hypothetical protein